MNTITIGSTIVARDRYGIIRTEVTRDFAIGEVIAIESNPLKVRLNTYRWDAWGCGWDYVHISTVTEVE